MTLEALPCGTDSIRYSLLAISLSKTAMTMNYGTNWTTVFTNLSLASGRFAITAWWYAMASWLLQR